MDKIATPQDLISELNSVIASVRSSEQPSKVALAKRLASITSKLASSHGEAVRQKLRPSVAGWFEDGIMIGVNCGVDFVWADSKAQAETWFKDAIKACQKGIDDLKKLTPPKGGK